MAEPKDPNALTEDGRAPVLGEDQAEEPIEPLEESEAGEKKDRNSQPG